MSANSTIGFGFCSWVHDAALFGSFWIFIRHRVLHGPSALVIMSSLIEMPKLDDLNSEQFDQLAKQLQMIQCLGIGYQITSGKQTWGNFSWFTAWFMTLCRLFSTRLGTMEPKEQGGQAPKHAQTLAAPPSEAPGGPQAEERCQARRGYL